MNPQAGFLTAFARSKAVAPAASGKKAKKQEIPAGVYPRVDGGRNEKRGKNSANLNKP
jgi:hypothetical protein